MKQPMNNTSEAQFERIDGHDAFGDMPQSFENAVLRALKAETPQPAPVRRVRLGLIVALLVVILTATGLAVARQYGLLDFLYASDRPPVGDVSGLIVTDIPVEGEQPKLAIFTVREATYTANILRFVVVAMPRAEGFALINEMDMDLTMYLDEALSYGERLLATYVNPWVPGVDTTGATFNVEREGAGLVYGFTMSLPTSAPPTVQVNLICSLFDPEEWPHYDGMEEVEITFALTRGEAGILLDTDIDIETPEAHITHIAVTHSPFELVLQVTYKPARLDTLRFVALDEEGRMLESVGSGLGRTIEADLTFDETAWATSEAPPETVQFWVYGTNTALVIDSATGMVDVRHAQMEHTEAGRRVVVE